MYLGGRVGQERDSGGYLKLVGRGDSSGNCRYRCRIEGLVESSGSTPYGSSSSPSVSSCPKTSHEGA